MRNSLFYLFACAALVTACQPVTSAPIKTQLSNPKLTINVSELLPAARPTSPVTPVPPAPPEPNVPSETLSSGNVDQNNSQSEIDLAIGTIITTSDTQTKAAQGSADITPQIIATPKTFDPKKIIGFATPVLIHSLGKASMVRQEGTIEVWQYQFASCVVDFFFYPVGEEGAQLIAKNWDMRSAVIRDRLDRDSCRADMDLYHQKTLSN